MRLDAPTPAKLLSVYLDAPDWAALPTSAYPPSALRLLAQGSRMSVNSNGNSRVRIDVGVR